MQPILHHAPLVLASGSTIRQQMLKACGLQFSVSVSGVDEAALKPTLADKPLPQQALALAAAKALAVSADQPDAYVIGADQICAIDGQILSKPGSYDRAEAQLKQLAGRTHQQHCAVVIAHHGAVVWKHTATVQLTMRPLDDAAIRAYVGADAPLSSCGSYKFEGLGRHLFTQVEGDFDTVQGLPMLPLLNALHTMKLIGLGA